MRRQAGFTLIELLVVMSLLAVLMGLSVGLVSRAGTGNQLLLAVNALADQFASARAQSYGDNRAYVVVETREDGRLVFRAYRNRQVFAWACEDFEKASESDMLRRSGGVEISSDFGMEGRYAVFSEGGAVTLGDPPWLDFVDGFSIRCRLRPDGRAGQLFRKGNDLYVAVTSGAAGRLGLQAKLRLEKGDDGQGGGDYEIRTGTREESEVVEWSSPLIPGRWHDVTVTYDRNSFSIYVDGRLRGIRSDRRNEMRRNDEPFTIGGGYTGGFDSLVISGIFEDDQDRFDADPNVVRIDPQGKPTPPGKQLVHFANRGLDPAHHTEPVAMWFRLERGPEGEGPRRIVSVSLSGETFVRRPE